MSTKEAPEPRPRLLAFARRSNNVDDFPKPDLDISRSKINRPRFYAALKVPEFCRLHKERFSIERTKSRTSTVRVVSAGILR
jgi:hypothetical protein